MLRILQVAAGQVVLEQLANAIVRDQEIPTPEKPEHRSPGDRENVVAGQPSPDGFEFENAFQRGRAGVVRAIDGADAGADDHIRGNAVGDQRVQHANLDCSKTAAAREHKCSLCRIVLNRRGQDHPPARRIAR